MAMTVSATIQLNDKMTSAIGHITSAMNIMLDELSRINSASNSAFDSSAIYAMHQHIDSVNAELTETSQKFDKVRETGNNAARSIQSSLGSMNNSVRNGISGFSKLESGITGVIGKIQSYTAVIAAAGAYGTKKLIDASDEWTGSSARLGLITNSELENNTLQKLIYQSAANSRSSYQSDLSNVAKLGLLAGDAFSSNAETVKFNELMNKVFKISGASTEERTAGMYQLTQAMASGKLQGDEFRSIMENAPLLAQAIADYTGKTKADLKEMSKEGEITSDIIKNSLMNASGDIEAKFADMPMTFGDSWTNMMSSLTTSFAPVYEQIERILNSDGVQSFLSGLPEFFDSASGKVQSFIFTLQGMYQAVSPSIKNLFTAIGSVSNRLLGVNGVAARVGRTILNTFASPQAVTSIHILAAGISTAAAVFQTLLNIATPLLPVITGIFTAFKAYQAVNSIISPIVSTIGALVSGVQSLASAAAGAEAAQLGLNAALSANPYGAVATAISAVVAGLVGLIAAIKGAKAVADIATSSNYSYENVTRINQVMEDYSVDRNAAAQLIDDYNSYQESISQNETARQAAYEEWKRTHKDEWQKIVGSGFYKGNYDLTTIAENASKISTPELYNIKSEYDANKQSLYDTWKKQQANVLSTYSSQAEANKALNAISDDPNDYFKNYEKLFGGSNAETTTALLDETAANTKETAENTKTTNDLLELIKDNWEKKVLSEYTAKATTVTYDFSNMNNSYSGTSGEFDAVREIQKYLSYQAAVGAEGV